MYQVDVSPQAVQDLLEIKLYIESELQNPIAAHNTVKKIVERYLSFHTDYKFVLANNYSIFYRTEGNFVKVIRIMYSKRDFIKILFGENETI